MNDLQKAMHYLHPDRIPVGVSFLPATWRKYGLDTLNAVRARYPLVFGEDIRPETEFRQPASYAAGSFTDAWGCVWRNIRGGHESIVTGHPLPTRESVRALRAPETDIGLPHGFLFLRLFDLRGWEEMLVDFAEEPPELQRLIDIVRDYDVRQMERMCADPAGAGSLVWVGDDNGMQHALPISPDSWRRYIKPAYKAIFDVARRAGRDVYFHTDGCVWQVIPDMQEAGATMVNPQFRANGLDNLVRVCRGKVPINLDLDRQLFPFATPDGIREHIRECTRALYLPEGGLGLTAEVAEDVPLENIEAICETLSECTLYRG